MKERTTPTTQVAGPPTCTVTTRTGSSRSGPVSTCPARTPSRLAGAPSVPSITKESSSSTCRHQASPRCWTQSRRRWWHQSADSVAERRWLRDHDADADCVTCPSTKRAGRCASGDWRLGAAAGRRRRPEAHAQSVGPWLAVPQADVDADLLAARLLTLRWYALQVIAHLSGSTQVSKSFIFAMD